MPYQSAYTGLEIDRAIGTVRQRGKVWDNKQQKLTGTSGQIVGFDARGNAVAQDFSGFGSGDFVKAKSHTVTMAADGWENLEQAVYIDGISADESAQLIQPVPASASFDAYAQAEIRARQSLNQIKFSCAVPPVTDLTVYVVVQEVKF